MKQDPRTIIDVTQDPGLHRNPIKSVVKIFKPPIHIPKYHWVPDKIDNRDYKYIALNKTIRDVIDLRPYCSPIEDQGNLGSCTGQAIAGAIELLNNRNGKSNDISRLFIYYFERELLGTTNYDSGAYIRDGIKVINKKGAPLEKLWPYIIRHFKNKPTNTAIIDAARRKVTLYERIENHEECIDAITSGYPVVAGFQVYSSFESSQVSKTGFMSYPNTRREKYLGGHAVLLVGYDRNKQVYIVRNSWGPSWGDKGYFYMPFQVIQNRNMSGDFWIIKSVLNP